MSTYTAPMSWLTRAVKVDLIGCGGTGSEMIDELFRMHTLLVELGGEGLIVTAYDEDKVSKSNIGRQRFWASDVGYNKAEILIKRLNSFGGTKWRYVDKDYKVGKDDPKYDAHKSDVTITCVDSASFRAAFGLHCSLNKTEGKERLWLDCGNDENSGNVILGHINNNDESTSLPNVFDLYPILSELKDLRCIVSCQLKIIDEQK